MSEKTGSWIPLPEAAQKLGVSWERAWRSLLRGELQGQKLDGRWYVTEASLEAAKATRVT